MKYLLVGAGLYNAVIYQRLVHEFGVNPENVSIIEKRRHIGGNCYTEVVGCITVHKYGAHIFHTSDSDVWKFATKFGNFNSFVNSPIAVYFNKCSGKYETYNLPFNMNTFVRLFECKLNVRMVTPDVAQEAIRREIAEYRMEHPFDTPRNLEEQAISLVGTTVYETLIRHYTEKQWGRPCTSLDPWIIKRLPLRFTYDNNYFDDRYQGVPEDGYSMWIENMFEGHVIHYGEDFLSNVLCHSVHGLDKFDKVFYSGDVSELLNCMMKLDPTLSNRVRDDGLKDLWLDWRSLHFREVTYGTDNWQGNAVVNYTSGEVDYTRTIEHRFFNNEAVDVPSTIVTYEYPVKYRMGMDAKFYPLSSEQEKYRAILKYLPKKIVPTGRLGLYQYLDMDDVIRCALNDNRL